MSELRDRLEETLGGTYVFERELTGGGMSRLFIAQERNLDRRVVVKVLPEHLAESVNVERFRREIQVSARLQHPHIVPLLSSGEVGGTPYFVMPFIDGESLEGRIRRKGELSVSEAVRFLREIASALAYAHKRGVVHRDIKPHNVLISEEIAVVTDFGIAKALEDSALSGAEGGTGPLTTSGAAIGTPAYMAPEQASADPVIDHRADIYSFGILAYEMLTGAPPFTGRSQQALLAAQAVQPPEAIERRRPGLPEPLSRLVMQCLEKRPADRPQSAQDLVQALDTMDTLSPARTVDAIPPRPLPRPSARRYGGPALLALAGAAVIAVTGYFSYRAGVPDTESASSSELNSVAVLPLVNVGGDSSDEYFSEGMTDELSTVLTKLPGLRVASRTSAYAFKDQRNVSVGEIGRKLNVQAVLEGTVRRSGGRLRVTAQLTSVADGLTLWADKYERESRDVFTVQDEIARSIAEALRPALRGQATDIGAATRGTSNLKAYDLFLRGRYFWNRRGADNLRTSISYFTQAIAEDPGFGRAHAGLAIAYALLPEYTDSPPPDAAARARRAAQRALELDPSLAEANTALGLVAIHDWNFADAEKRYQAALRQEPGYATAWQWYGELLYHTGRVDSSVVMMRRASELDPLAPIIPTALGYALILARRYDEALLETRRGMEIAPTLSLHHSNTAMASLWKGDTVSAIRAMELAAGLDPEVALRQGQLAFVYGKTGRRAQAEAVIRRLEERGRSRSISPVAFALGYLALGDTDRALGLLEKAVDEHDISIVTNAAILTDAMYDPLRGDPRFTRIIARMNLLPYLENARSASRRRS